MNRRIFIKTSGLALFGSALMPDAFVRMADAATTGGKKILVAIFQRGAVDGLNMVVPYGEAAYYSARRSIAIPRPGASGGAIDLDGFFGMHPAMKSLSPWFKDKSLAFIHAVGLPVATRSHFDAQDFMESGTPGIKSTRDGFLSRALSGKPAVSPLRAVSVTSALPRILAGKAGAIAAPRVDRFGIRAESETFEEMYAESVADSLRATAAESFDAAEIIDRSVVPAGKEEYPRGPLAASLRQIAQLIKSDVGLEVAFAEVGGWDTHAGEGGSEGQLANNLRLFSDSIAAFARDLGSKMADVTLVTMSEFGRTVRENGNRGTDHGHATVMLTLGSGVRGGKVYGAWPGLAPEKLFEGRDLAVTTDYRDVFAELLQKNLRVASLAKVFPGYAPRSLGIVS